MAKEKFSDKFDNGWKNYLRQPPPRWEVFVDVVVGALLFACAWFFAVVLFTF